jgi:hypothetical protein
MVGKRNMHTRRNGVWVQTLTVSEVTSVDPGGSGQLNEVIYLEDEIIRSDTRPLRA